MIINKPWLCTKLEIWAPKYNTVNGGWEVWLSKSKVHHATSIILVEFTKAKHLLGQRFAITRDKVQRCREVSNGKIPCYAVPFAMLKGWDSGAEVINDLEQLGWL